MKNVLKFTRNPEHHGFLFVELDKILAVTSGNPTVAGSSIYIYGKESPIMVMESVEEVFNMMKEINDE